MLLFAKSSGTSDAFEPYGLLFLHPLVVDSQQPPVRCDLCKIDVLSEDMRPDIRRKPREILVLLERIPQTTAGNAVDNSSAIDMAAEVEIARLRRNQNPPLICTRLTVGDSNFELRRSQASKP